MARKKKPVQPLTEVPEAAIRFVVGNEHVGVPDQEIRAKVVARCKKSGADDALAAKCGSYGVKVHQENRRLYDQVMRGRF